jgi:hypothetical protein
MLSFIVFVYEVFRFLLLFFLLLSAEASAGGGAALPPVLYASAISLFPMMAFFLWLDGKKYRPFLYLYTAGKVISVFAVAVSIFSAFDTLSFLTAEPAKTTTVLFALCLLAFLDLLLLLRAALSLKAKETGDNASR